MANCFEFIVKDYDSVGANDILGSVLVKKTDLLEGNGDRVEYVLNTTRHSQEGDIRVGNKTVGILGSYDDKVECDLSKWNTCPPQLQ